MSIQNHSVAVGAYLARIQSIVPSARATKTIQSNRSKRHSIQDTRTAVAEKLRANLAYLKDSASAERPDLVFKEQADGSYAVGIKYGNRWLAEVFDGANYIEGLNRDQVCEVLELFAADAEAGQYDKFIEPIMEANLAARHKAH